MLKYINGVNNAPAAIGPYSQAVIVGRLAYLSGQVPIDPETGTLVEGGIEPQANQVMKNLFAVLDHMGLDFSHVVKTTIFLMSMEDFKYVNKIYGDWMGEVKPARATIQVAGLPLGALIEIEMIAEVSSQDSLMTFEGGVENLENLADQGYQMDPKTEV